MSIDSKLKTKLAVPTLTFESFKIKFMAEREVSAHWFKKLDDISKLL